MKPMRFPFLLAAAALIAGCATEPKNTEVKKILDWKLAFNQSLPNGGQLHQFIPADESPDSWRHRFNVTFQKLNMAAPRDSLRTQAEAVCARNSSETSAQLKKMGKPDCQVSCNFISTDEQSLVFEIPQSCSATNTNYQLLRWVTAADGIYYFSYLQKKSVTPWARDQWLAILNAAKPAKGDRIRDYFD